MVYLLLAACLFPELGYLGMWQKLISGLDGVDLPTPTGSALSQARQRVATTPLRWLFNLLRGPAAALTTPGVRW